jgi:hypothetical protein
MGGLQLQYFVEEKWLLLTDPHPLSKPPFYTAENSTPYQHHAWPIMDRGEAGSSQQQRSLFPTKGINDSVVLGRVPFFPDCF